jgi:maspardin
LRARLNALTRGPELPLLDLQSERTATVESADGPLIPLAMREEVRAWLKPAIAYIFQWGGHSPSIVRPELCLSLLEEQLGLAITSKGWGAGELRAR